MAQKESWAKKNTLNGNLKKDVKIEIKYLKEGDIEKFWFNSIIDKNWSSSFKINKIS